MSKLLVVQVLILFVSFCASQNITNNTNKIPTLALTPNTIHIRVSDLPDPYHTPDIDKFAQVVTRPENATLNVPERFEVNLFKEGITAPRWLALTPTGDLLVTQTSLKQITLLRDTDNDGVADVTKIFAGPENGLNKPFGMAFHEGYFYLGNYLDVRRYPYTQGQEKLVGEGEIIIDNLPEGEHWTRNVVISPDGTKLFVSVGSDDNAAVEPAPSATVMIMNLDGSDVQTFAAGLRNPNGLKLHPVTKELYTTINERDHLGDDLVPDYFTRIRQGEFFGWPYAYLSPEKMDPRIVDSDGNSLSPELVASTITPDVLFQAHSCALGLDFYTGSTFPSSYKNGAFVALKGSYNRHTGTGYKIVFIPFGQNNRPMGSYQDFVTGFMIDPDVPTTWGRPVGVLVLPDGSLIFSDEPNGNIYRVQYNAPPSSTYGTRLSSLYALLVLLYIFISM